MSTNIKVASFALAAVALMSASASAMPFHKGWVLAPNGSVHQGWVSLSRGTRTAYAYQPATAPTAFAHDPTMYAIQHNIPVPPVQLPGGGQP